MKDFGMWLGLSKVWEFLWLYLNRFIVEGEGLSGDMFMCFMFIFVILLDRKLFLCVNL